MDQTFGEARWSTDGVDRSRQYDAWVAQLNATFGRWQADNICIPEFRADVKANSLPGMAMVECQCDPCGGTRSRNDANAIDSEQLTIQLVVSGREFMKLGEQEAVLSQGDIFVWDNTQAMRFSVLEPLHKISLVMPLQRLKAWVPNGWRDLPRHMRGGDPGTEMLATYLRSLSHLDHANNPMRYNALIEAAIAMLVAPIPDRVNDGSQRMAQLEIVKSKIMSHLRDPDLDLDMIAKMNRISLRYLHWLFEASDSTPWRFVVNERLEGCRRDLVNADQRQRSITEIAFSWGFSNAAHFGRKVREKYGMTPSELREQAMQAALH